MTAEQIASGQRKIIASLSERLKRQIEDNYADGTRLDWLDLDAERVEDVFGHLVREGGSVRDAIDALMKRQAELKGYSCVGGRSSGTLEAAMNKQKKVTKASIRKAASELADFLFESGSGKTAIRLVLVDEAGNDLGAWGKGSVAVSIYSRIARMLGKE